MKRGTELLEIVVSARERMSRGVAVLDDAGRMLDAIEAECRAIVELIEGWDRARSMAEFEAFVNQKCREEAAKETTQ